MLIHIDHSSLALFGREIEVYGLIAVIGAAVITVLHAYLAHCRGLDASFTFRILLLCLFPATAFHVFFQGMLEGNALYPAFAVGILAFPCAFWVISRLFGHDGIAFSQMGILSALAYSAVTRCCCLFAGCCYGPPWKEFPALIYGPDTHNPLSGTALFPLQLVQAAILFGLLLIGIAFFLKKRPGILLWIMEILNLAVYYTGLLISPATAGEKKGLASVVILLYTFALSLLVYFIITYKKRRMVI